MTPEAKVRNPVVKWAKANGILHIRMHMGRGASAGWPDDLFIHCGDVAFIEFKRPGKGPTLLQERRIKDILAQNVNATYFDDSHYAIAWLRTLFRIPAR